MADTVVVRDTLIIKDTTANPAPLGLFAFGMSTILLNLHNAGFFGLNSLILGMGLFFGGLAQIIAGVLEWKKNNTFGATAFTSYGCFWILLVFAVLANIQFPSTSFATPNANNDPHLAFASFLVLWGLFTTGLFIGTFRLSVALVVVFGSLALLFFLLAAGQYNPAVLKFAGYEGIFCGASACYTGLASVLNEVYGRSLLPIGSLARS
jgi:succinate-acetate transporter protein